VPSFNLILRLNCFILIIVTYSNSTNNSNLENYSHNYKTYNINEIMIITDSIMDFMIDSFF